MYRAGSRFDDFIATPLAIPKLHNEPKEAPSLESTLSKSVPVLPAAKGCLFGSSCGGC